MESSAEAAVPPPSRSKVLVADDERIIADTLAIILNQAGFEATAVYDGNEAVNKAQTWKPDLLLSDVVMPGLNGIEAAIEVRKIIPACKVLLFSGQAETAHMLREVRMAGHDFEILPKPVHPHELLSRLRTL